MVFVTVPVPESKPTYCAPYETMMVLLALPELPGPDPTYSVVLSVV
jgi:hypothetical protein